MGFVGITVDSIVGDESSGVQSMFPRFSFDADSLPSLAQVQTYARKSMSVVARQVSFKGYDPATIVGDDDLEFITNWIELAVAAEIHAALDQFKDNPVANSRQAQLRDITRQFADSEDPFPTIERASRSSVVDIFPARLVRVNLSGL